jgi:hypothetical protein
LKTRVLDEVSLLKVDSRDTIFERKIFKRKRTIKAEEKKSMTPPSSLAPPDNYKYPRESIRMSIQSSSRVTRSQRGAKKVGFGIGSKRALN